MATDSEPMAARTSPTLGEAIEMAGCVASSPGARRPAGMGPFDLSSVRIRGYGAAPVLAVRIAEITPTKVKRGNPATL